MAKIAFVIESLGIGGAEKSLVTLLHNYHFSGHDVTLIIMKKEGRFLDFVPDFVTIKDIEMERPSLFQRVSFFLKRKNIHVHSAQTFWKVFSGNFKIFPQDFDIAIAYNQGFATYYVAEKIKATKKFAWVNTDYIKAGYHPETDLKFYEKFNAVITVSDHLRKIFLEAFPQISTMTVYDITLPEEVLRKAEENNGVDFSDSVNIVTVGRLAEAKNPLLAVETAKILHNRSVNFVWYWVGDGTLRKALEEKINQYGLEQHMKLLGHQLNPYPFIKAADVYVHTSKFEGWGLTLVEAKILGKPVITTDFPTAHEIIEEGESGLISNMTAAALADCIQTVIENHNLRLKLSAHNIIQVEARIQDTFNKVERLLYKH